MYIMIWSLVKASTHGENCWKLLDVEPFHGFVVSDYHCAKNVVYASVYFCVYFAYTINIPRVVYISKIQLEYFKNPQVTIIHCVYSRSIKNTQTTMNYANLDNFRKNRYEFRY